MDKASMLRTKPVEDVLAQMDGSDDDSTRPSVPQRGEEKPPVRRLNPPRSRSRPSPA